MSGDGDDDELSFPEWVNGAECRIEDTRIAKLLSEDASGVGFSPQRHVVEVQGVCKDCGTA